MQLGCTLHIFISHKIALRKVWRYIFFRGRTDNTMAKRKRTNQYLQNLTKKTKIQ